MNTKNNSKTGIKKLAAGQYAKPNIHFDLLNNAKDSLHHAVEHLIDPEDVKDGIEAGDVKLAIREVAHAVELLLKERLKIVHPAFIWRDIDQYPNDEASTVNSIEAIERLKRIGGISLDQNAIDTIRMCRKLRNSIEHYEFHFNLKEAKGVIGRMLSFIFDFAKTNLNLDLEKEFRDDDSWKELVAIFEFWEAHSQTVARRLLSQGKHVTHCPSCGAETFTLEVMRCALCGHSESEIECDVCNNITWESEINRSAGLNMCRECYFKKLHNESGT